MSDLIERLRAWGALIPTVDKAADAPEQQAGEIERLRAELDLRRKSGDPIQRLHNLCEGIAEGADGSEWSREEWAAVDAETVRLEAENAELRMDNEVLRASCVAAAEHVEWLREANYELLKDAARLDWIEQQATSEKIEMARSCYRTGFEIGLWPSHRVLVANGPLRAALDAAMEGNNK